MQELSVDLPVAPEMAKNKARSVLSVLQKRNTAAFTVFERFQRDIFLFDAGQQIRINDSHLSGVCRAHIDFT